MCLFFLSTLFLHHGRRQLSNQTLFQNQRRVAGSNSTLTLLHIWDTTPPASHKPIEAGRHGFEKLHRHLQATSLLSSWLTGQLGMSSAGHICSAAGCCQNHPSSNRALGCPMLEGAGSLGALPLEVSLLPPAAWHWCPGGGMGSGRQKLHRPREVKQQL